MDTLKSIMMRIFGTIWHDKHARNRAAAFYNRDNKSLKTLDVAVGLEEIIFYTIMPPAAR